MEISVKLFSDFSLYHSPSTFTMRLGGRKSVVEILRGLKIPEDLPRVILVNGHAATEQSKLEDGDILSVFSPVAGG
jgi:sulfur carrier protein ThiS